MAERRRKCTNDPNAFCYICGDYMMKDKRRGITSFIKRSYQAYFGMKIVHQDRSWAPLQCCTSCTESLRKWTNAHRTRPDETIR